MFRDKKSLSMMLLTPIMIPLMILGMSALFESQVNTPVDDYNRIGFNYEMNDIEENLAASMDIKVIHGNTKDLKEK